VKPRLEGETFGRVSMLREDRPMEPGKTGPS
jgi:hypothetical protein